jgi:hypothetical protein
VFFFIVYAFPAVYYVSPTGSDNAAGTMTAPFATWAKGQTAASAGDTVFFRAGVYYYTKATTNCTGQTATVNTVVLNKSGTSGNLIHYMAYPGEIPIFDFYGDTNDCRIRGVDVSGSWLHLKGLELRGLPQNNNKNHENWVVFIEGSNNIFEQLKIHNNMGPGIFIQEGDGNLVLNCDSYDNYDLYSSNGAGNNADGFGCHTTTYPGVAGVLFGNIFDGCRAWSNSDDGFDCIHCWQPALIENCWIWMSGYLPGTRTPSPAGNGNGFKVGGWMLPPSGYPTPVPQHTVENCLAFWCMDAGFYQNHHPANNNYFNNTSFGNGVDFNMLGYDLTTSTGTGMGTYENCIAYEGTATDNSGPENLTVQSHNSWDLDPAITLTNAAFQSIDTTGITGPRKADGSLPDVPFMHLAAGSICISKGINVGLPYSGAAPDLGCFPYSATAVLSGAPVTRKANGFYATDLVRLLPGVHLYDLTGRAIPAANGRCAAGIFIYKAQQGDDAHVMSLLRQQGNN